MLEEEVLKSLVSFFFRLFNVLKILFLILLFLVYTFNTLCLIHEDFHMNIKICIVSVADFSYYNLLNLYIDYYLLFYSFPYFLSFVFIYKFGLKNLPFKFFFWI